MSETRALDRWWISSRKMSVGVTVNDENIIVAAAPIVRRFIGQPLINLANWMNSHGPGLQTKRLSPCQEQASTTFATSVPMPPTI